ACAALAEVEFAERSRHENDVARAAFAADLRRVGLTVYPSSANFLLVRLPRGRGADLARWLEPHRVLVRRCDSFLGLGDEYVRLSVQSRENNERLAGHVEAWLRREEAAS